MCLYVPPGPTLFPDCLLSEIHYANPSQPSIHRNQNLPSSSACSLAKETHPSDTHQQGQSTQNRGASFCLGVTGSLSLLVLQLLLGKGMGATVQCEKLHFLFETLKGDASTPSSNNSLWPNPNSSAVAEIIFTVDMSQGLTSSLFWHIQGHK